MIFIVFLEKGAIEEFVYTFGKTHFRICSLLNFLAGVNLVNHWDISIYLFADQIQNPYEKL